MRLLSLFSLLCILASCNSSKKTVAARESDGTTLSATLAEKQMNGVDFFARGNAPATWSVEMEFGNLIRFKSLDGNDVNASAVQPVYIEAQNATIYTSGSNIQVTLYNEPCKDAASGETFNKKVKVRVKDKVYEGCGQYLSDAKLNGSWKLQTMNGNPVLGNKFAKGAPTIQLDLSKQAITGHDGCNQLSGTFEVMGDKIRFADMIQTQMACPSNPSTFNFGSLISGQTISYFFKEGLLHFYLKDDSILIFAKG